MNYATAAATASKNRTDATVAASEMFRDQKVQHQSQHATDYSWATFNKITSVMAAAKTNSINIATGNDPAAENTILDGLITTANNAAESGYNTADKNYLLAEVGTQSTRANSVATAQRNYAVAMAWADEGLTNGYAGAGLTYDLQQASEDYLYAVAIAGATGTAQAAQYADRATALATLQALVSKPWTAFMRDVATAEATWAAGQAGNYVTYQTALATAQQTYDINTANAVHTQTTTESAVERQWIVDVANHARTAALGHSAADLAYATAVINSSSSLASAQGTWLTDNANATFTQTTTDASSQLTHQNGLANAVFAYSQTEAGEAQTQTQTVATATAAFEVATAAVYAAAMSAFSLVQPSPWATQQALFAQARLAWVTAVAPVYVTQQFADAATEYSQNMATANQKLSDANTAATTAFNATNTSANDALSAALAQAADVASGTEVSGLSLPLLPALPDNERLGALSPQRHGEDDGPDYTTVFSFFPKRLQNQGSQGDLGYYLNLVHSIQLNHIDTNSDDGYSNDYSRLLGEWIIRPLVGDAILATASDTELLIGTAAFVVFGAGVAFCPGPALVGAFMSAGQSAVGQYVTTGTVDFHQVFVAGIIGGASGVGGAVGGLVLGRAVSGATQLSRNLFGANITTNVCKTATFLVQTTVKLNQVQQTVNTAVAIANGDVNAAAGLAFSFGMGRFTKALSFCFVAGTHIELTDPAELAAYQLALTRWQQDVSALRFASSSEPPRYDDGNFALLLSSVGLVAFGFAHLPKRQRRKTTAEKFEALLNESEADDEPRGDGSDRAPEANRQPESIAAAPRIDDVFAEQTPADWMTLPAMPSVVSTPHIAKPTRSPLGKLWTAACLLLAATCFWSGLPSSVKSPTPAVASVAAPSQELPPRPELVRRTKAIEDIQEDDLVLSMDPDTGELALKRVIDSFSRTADHLRLLTIVSADGHQQIHQTTDDHPYWLPDSHEWLPAKSLDAGDKLLAADGSLQIVKASVREEHPEGIPVYNFSVEDWHAYFASGNENDQTLLVHNENCRRRSNGQFAAKPGPKPSANTNSTHANSLNTTKPARGYTLRDRDNGEVLKFGETTRGKRRYSDKYLDENNAKMRFEKSGSKREMHEWQHEQILKYTDDNGVRPPLNLNDY